MGEVGEVILSKSTAIDEAALRLLRLTRLVVEVFLLLAPSKRMVF